VIASVLLVASGAGLVGVFAIIALWGGIYEPNVLVLGIELAMSTAILTYGCIDMIRQLRARRGK
jgi:hypothetical protein